MMDKPDFNLTQEMMKRFLKGMSNITYSNAGMSSTNQDTRSAPGDGVGSFAKPLIERAAPESKQEVDEFFKDTLISLQAQADDLAKSTMLLKQSEKTASNLLRQSQKQMDELEVRLAEANEALSKSHGVQAKLLDEVQTVKANAVSALAIFVSFFAFITVSINVFAKAGSIVSGAALIVAFWAMLVGFNLLIGWQLNTIKNNLMAFWLLFSVMVISVGALLVMYSFAPNDINAAKMVLEPPKAA